MCAINPTHKKRVLFDFYTSHKMTEQEFNELVAYVVTTHEVLINSHHPMLRLHVKETTQEAD